MFEFMFILLCNNMNWFKFEPMRDRGDKHMADTNGIFAPDSDFSIQLNCRFEHERRKMNISFKEYITHICLLVDFSSYNSAPCYFHVRYHFDKIDE